MPCLAVAVAVLSQFLFMGTAFLMPGLAVRVPRGETTNANGFRRLFSASSSSSSTPDVSPDGSSTERVSSFVCLNMSKDLVWVSSIDRSSYVVVGRLTPIVPSSFFQNVGYRPELHLYWRTYGKSRWAPRQVYHDWVPQIGRSYLLLVVY
jgi:hypothetical protein